MPDTNSSPVTAPVAAEPKRAPKALIAAAVAFFAIIVVGLIIAFNTSSNPVGAGWYIFSFTMGLTMIVLPCTFPLAFVIVPLAMGKGPRKGFMIALAFGSGVAIMLSLYGVAAAWLGKTAISGLGADLESVKNVMYLVAGIFAYVFALGELGFLKFRMPSFSGAAPMFIQRQGDVVKALLLGLFLGNIGVGCPHPATPVILTRIAVSGDVFYGWSLFFVHALGRVIPLLLLALLAILGVNGLSLLVKHKEKIERATGWAMVFVAGFILVLGLFTHAWWVNSGQHTLLEAFTQEERWLGIVKGNLNSTVTHAHGLETVPGMFGLPLWLGNWVLVALWIVPIWWYYSRKKRESLGLAPDEAKKEAEIMPWRRRYLLALSALLIAVFALYLPNRFEFQAMMGADHHAGPAVAPLTISLDADAASIRPGKEAQLNFVLADASGKPLEKLQLGHERYFHVIIVHEDLKSFAHIHPDDSAEVTDEMLLSGGIPVQATFEREGRYLIAVNTEYKNQEVAKQFFLKVGAQGAASITKDLSRVKKFGNYTVALSAEPALLRAGEEVSLKYLFERDGAFVKDLRGYLGAPMHLAIMSADQSYFVHTHGEVHDASGAGKHEVTENDYFGPAIEAHVVFPGPGLYQIFGQARHEDTVITTSFMLEVGPGAPGMTMGASAGHGH
jgi:cytochrome c-type biogenesis protein